MIRTAEQPTVAQTSAVAATLGVSLETLLQVVFASLAD